MRMVRRGYRGALVVLVGIGVALVSPGAVHLAPTPAVTTQLSTSNATTGDQVTDQATLSGVGPSSAGTMTYNVYTSSDCSGTPVFTSQVTVANAVVPPSAAFTASPPGVYQWQAVYKAYPKQAGIVSPCGSEPLTVTNSLSISTVLSSQGVLPGTPVTDQATLSGATSDASGTLTYDVYTSSDCSGTPVFTSTVAVSGGAAPASAAFTPSQTGIYQWLATYSGDADNDAAASACGSEPLSVGSVVVQTQLSATSVSVGSQVTDQATLVGATSNASGTVTYDVYSTSDCSGTPVFTSSVGVNSGSVPGSAAFTASPAGSYQWRATYSGDGSNAGATSPCGAESLLVQNAPTLTTQSSESSALKDDSVTDQATLSGVTSDAGGTLTYYLYSTSDCSGDPVLVSTVAVTNGSAPASAPFVGDVIGNYQWQGFYSGDARNKGATSTCGSDPLTVSAAPMVPLMDMGTSTTYYGLTGGLYADGSDTMPSDHETAGLAVSNGIVPLDTNGNPSPTGKIVLMSIGASNQSQEWCGRADKCETPSSPSFMSSVAASTSVNHTTLEVVNGAQSGQSIAFWMDPDSHRTYDVVRDDRLTPLGLTEAQVQIIWLSDSDAGATVSLPNAGADAYTVESRLGTALRAMKTRYPNLKEVFLSSRIYGGYATTIQSPEPYAYETGFSVKWTIQSQITQMETGSVDPVAGDLDEDTVAPWIAWGPYMWANGTTPRSDGLTWVRGEFGNDGTHVNSAGRRAVAGLLMNFFLNSEFTRCWFLSTPESCSS